MPWSAGSFSRTNGVNSGADTWEQDRDEPAFILASRHDDHDQDLADGINNCLTKDGTNTPTANIPMGGFKFTSLGSGTANGQATIFDQFSWTSWVPTFTPEGAMTYSGQTLSYAKYIQINKLVLFRVSVSGTVGGTPAEYVGFSLPVTANSNAVAGSVTVVDGGLILPGSMSFGSTTRFDMRRQALTAGLNLTAGAVSFTAFGFYEAA